MEALGDFLERSDLGLQETKYNEQGDGVEISEILRQEESPKLETRKIANIDVVPWVNKCIAVADGDHQSFGIMHMVWVGRIFKYDARNCDISKSNQEYILQRFELKRVCQIVPDRGFISLLVGDRQLRTSSLLL